MSELLKTTFLKGKAPQRRSISRGFSDGGPLLAKVWKPFPVHLTG